jgi:hypothetical protein
MQHAQVLGGHHTVSRALSIGAGMGGKRGAMGGGMERGAHSTSGVELSERRASGQLQVALPPQWEADSEDSF